MNLAQQMLPENGHTGGGASSGNFGRSQELPNEDSSTLPDGVARFHSLQEQVAQLNRIGTELFLQQRHGAALFQFNEAFQLVTLKGGEVLDAPIDFNSSSSRGGGSSAVIISEMFSTKPPPPQDFMQPLLIIEKGDPISMADVKAWILLSATTLMLNAAMGHHRMKKWNDAEQLLLMAIELSQEGLKDALESEEELSQENEPGGTTSGAAPSLASLRRSYYVKMVHMATLFVLGHVRAEHACISDSNTRTSDDTINEQEENDLRQCLSSLRECLTLSEELLGDQHLASARIFALIGRTLLRSGYRLGAYYAFQSADAIYNKPRIMADNNMNPSMNDGDWDSNHGSTNMTMCETRSISKKHLSDLEFSAMVMGEQGWSFGAEAA
jgi:hypothetical protein